MPPRSCSCLARQCALAGVLTEAREREAEQAAWRPFPTPIGSIHLRRRGRSNHHPSCFENLATNLAPFGIAGHHIPTTFNSFMNVIVQPSGEIRIDPPLSKAGDYLRLPAEMDLIVGLPACSADMRNCYRFKPISA